ncbi:ketoacyl-ACP synthase III [Nocardia arthritidis]|uniref:Ketoacyl-ACP synthase III n=1 Tax=Nocardia arthritidis TaxID=228602 RepID=A0A6G9Y6F3_9NOCA|nr:ketoacyl-ACP synthase III [Nocardia arthritidis]QIS08782.1 ketoacyl-ACP synthase III [Nocardia arthritidis]
MSRGCTTTGEVVLAAIGTHLPQDRISNLTTAAELGVDEGLLTDKIGVMTRAVKKPGQRTSDLCCHAYADLQARIPLEPEAIQLLCVVTQNPDMPIPHTAALLHERLGLSAGCMTFDLSQGCAGYTHGLAVATALADRFALDHILLFTCDPYTAIVDPHDRNTALIFGDGATASYLTRGAPGYRLGDADFGTAPATSSVLRYTTRHLEMDGRAVFLNAAREAPASIRRLLDRNHLDLIDIDLFLIHPGSRRIVDVLRKELGVDQDRLPFEIAEYGNTVSSSIPLMLAERLHQNPPQTILLTGFGVGFCWGTCLMHHIDQDRDQS